VIIHCETNVILCRYLQTSDTIKRADKNGWGAGESPNHNLKQINNLAAERAIKNPWGIKPQGLEEGNINGKEI
jgi:hypothetical protein